MNSGFATSTYLEKSLPSSVTERDGAFQPGKNGHNHPAEVGTTVAAKVVTKAKAKAAQEKFRSAAAIVDKVSVLTLS